MSTKRHMKPINCELGLHGLGQTGHNPFQWTYLTDQCHRVFKCLDKLIDVSKAKVPMRQRDFCLTEGARGKIPSMQESQDPTLDHLMHERMRERILEHKILQYSEGIKNRPVLKNICNAIHWYQVPLCKHKAPKGTNAGWKAIDLLGSTSNGLPVIFELKCDNVTDRKGKGTNETPLRMIVEAAAYGVALRKMWEKENTFKAEWEKILKLTIVEDELKTCQLVGIAPKKYWDRAFDTPGKRGAAPKGFWQEFKILCEALKDRGLPVALASVLRGKENQVIGLEIEETPATKAIKP